jgi:hypothetical protein
MFDVVLVEKYQEGRYSNKEFDAASGGRKEETKCLIVVWEVNSMGRSLLPEGSRRQVFQEGSNKRKRGILVEVLGRRSHHTIDRVPIGPFDIGQQHKSRNMG